MAGRVTQAGIEVVSTPTDAKARVSQDGIEVISTPTSTKARVSQGAIEVLVYATTSLTIPAASLPLTAPVPSNYEKSTIDTVALPLTTPMPYWGEHVHFPPAASLPLTAPPPTLPLFLHLDYFNIGGIGTWEHEDPFDILEAPLVFNHEEPFNIGTSVGWTHEDPFDIQGFLLVTHDDPFSILSEADPVVGGLPPPPAIVTVVLTAPTDGTAILHVSDTTDLRVGQTATIGTYTATVIAVGVGTVTLDRIIP